MENAGSFVRVMGDLEILELLIGGQFSAQLPC